MRNLSSASETEQRSFFQSFDYVFCDVDGVLWHYPQPIPGSKSAIEALQNLNKKVILVSNRTSKTHEEVHKQLQISGFNFDLDLIMPEVAIISHLKNLNYNKEIYFLGMTPLKSALQKSGFKICEYPPNETDESVQTFIKMTVSNQSEDVGAVITDIDTNTTYLKLQKAARYLGDPEVLYMTGNSDSKYLNWNKSEERFFNSGYFDWILEDFTKRKALRLAKPSRQYGEFIQGKYKIKGGTRVLFIGDSVEEDMAFATNCGYQKMLVLSGMTSEENIFDWEFPEEYKPEYYVYNLGEITNLLTSLNKPK